MVISVLNYIIKSKSSPFIQNKEVFNGFQPEIWKKSLISGFSQKILILIYFNIDKKNIFNGDIFLKQHISKFYNCKLGNLGPYFTHNGFSGNFGPCFTHRGSNWGFSRVANALMTFISRNVYL